MMIYTSGVDSAMARAIVISLFSWRRALPSDPVDDSDLQGWWGDSFPSAADDRIGSRLWLLRRRTLTQQTMLDAIFYAREALQWLVEDGLVEELVITAERRGISQLSMRVVETGAEGSDGLLMEFNDIWQVIQNGL